MLNDSFYYIFRKGAGELRRDIGALRFNAGRL